MFDDEVKQAKEQFLKVALRQFEEDPSSKELRGYINSHSDVAHNLSKNIRGFVSGEAGITVESIEQCKRDILRLGQIAHVIKTLSAGDTEYRKHIANEFRNMLEEATDDYHTILNWTRFGGERRL